MRNSIRFILILCIILLTISSVAGASGEGELHIIVMLEDSDVSMATQVMIMSNGVPNMLAPGQEKKITLPAGAYSLMAMLPGEMLMPGNTEVIVSDGDTKEVTMRLQPMPQFGFGFPGMEDMEEDIDDDMEWDMSGLGQMGMDFEPEEPDFVPEEANNQELLDLLVGDDKDLQDIAIEELGNRRDAASELVVLLDNHCVNVRSRVMDTLVVLSEEQPDGMMIGTRPIDDVMDEIIPALADSHPPVRAATALVVGNAWYFPQEAIPLLIEGLKDHDFEVRLNSVQAIGAPGRGRRGGEYAAELVEALQQVMSDEDAELRAHAARVLPIADYPREELVVILVAGLKDKDVEVRQTTARALAGFDEHLVLVESSLLSALNDPDHIVRARVLAAMAKLPASELDKHVNTVANMLKDEHEVVRLNALEVLWEAGPASVQVLSVLRQALSDPSARVVERVVTILWVKLGDKATPALPEILALINQNDPDLVGAISKAYMVLANIGSPAVPGLTQLLTHESERHRYQAATSLGMIGPSAEMAVPELTTLFENEDEVSQVRRAAFFALRDITGEEPEH